MKKLDDRLKNKLIKAAWQDDISFEFIHKEYNFTEEEIIALMRKELKPSSFKLWRKRVSGKLSKHEKLSKALRKEHKTESITNEVLEFY